MKGRPPPTKRDHIILSVFLCISVAFLGVAIRSMQHRSSEVYYDSPVPQRYVTDLVRSAFPKPSEANRMVLLTSEKDPEPLLRKIRPNLKGNYVVLFGNRERLFKLSPGSKALLLWSSGPLKLPPDLRSIYSPRNLNAQGKGQTSLYSQGTVPGNISSMFRTYEAEIIDSQVLRNLPSKVFVESKINGLLKRRHYDVRADKSSDDGSGNL